MPRPTKFRKVEFFPEECYFVPFGKENCSESCIALKIEELEAMRLKDIEGLNQEACAEKMQISRQTFQNIIDSARKKVALALTEGRAISIQGGCYISKHCLYICRECGEIYEPQQENDVRCCPKCGGCSVECERKTHCSDKWCTHK